MMIITHLKKGLLAVALLALAGSANAALMRVDFSVSETTFYENVGAGNFVFDSNKLFQPAPEANFYAPIESLDLRINFDDVKTAFTQADLWFYNFEIDANKVVKDINFAGMNADGVSLKLGHFPFNGEVRSDLGWRFVIYTGASMTELVTPPPPPPPPPPPAEVPEPATLGLIGIGLLGLAGLRRNRR